MGMCASSGRSIPSPTGSMNSGFASHPSYNRFSPVVSRKKSSTVQDPLTLGKKERDLIIKSWPELVKQNPKLFHEIWTQVRKRLLNAQ